MKIKVNNKVQALKGELILTELLVKNNFLKYSREGKNKHYFFDLNDRITLSLIKMLETFKELEFSRKNPEIAILFKEISGDFILFGSYAKGIAKKDSDIDLIIIGKNKEKINKITSKYPFEVNPFFFTLPEFRRILNKKEALGKEIVKDHIIFGNKEKIIEMFI